jgi:hypothetical protein
MRSLTPMRALIVCNSDVPWGAEFMPYWTFYHGVQCETISFPFGTSCLDSTKGWQAGTYRPGSREAFYNDLIRPVQEAAESFGANAVFMGPGTPMYVELPDRENVNRVISLPPIFGVVHGIVRLVERFGYPLPSVYGPYLAFDDSATLPDYGFVREGGLNTAITNTYKYYGGTRWSGNPEEYQQNYGTFVNSCSGWPGLPRQYKGKLGFAEQDLPTAGLSAFKRAFFADPMLVGRFGRPVFHRQAASARAYVGDENPIDTLTIARNSIANSQDIAYHSDKPIWVGVSERNGGMTDLMCAAAVDVLRRAGFSNINFFTRTINSIRRPQLEECIKLSDRRFTYSQIPSKSGNDCFLYVGYALHNEVPGEDGRLSSTGVPLTVQGVHVDKLFNWLPGSLTFAGTSFPARHVMRNLKQGGSGGISCEYEPGFRDQPQSLVYNLLKGCSLAETQALTNCPIGGVSFPVGDPLYAPFRHERGENENWYPPAGTPFIGDYS